MIKFITGDILHAEVDALVNTVNVVGVMGKGIALAFKKAFPENYQIYKAACEKKAFDVGDILVTQTGQLAPRLILNFPTKKHWRGRSKIEYIEVGLKKLVQTIKDHQISSIAIPPLGCGNGGLDWEIVRPLILKSLETVGQEVEIIIYEPGFNNQTTSKKNISLTPARAMLMSALKNYQVLGYSINLLVAQKIAYFLQRFGEPLNLEYEKGYYGPYSHRLQHLLKYLNGYYLQFNNEDIKPSAKVTLNHFEKVEAYCKTELSIQQLERLKKVQMLIEGFESPYGLELLATVDYIHTEKGIEDTEKIISEIGDWTKRKKDLMKPFHINAAHQRLKASYLDQSL